ncbi:SDR family oxidoreductase [Microbacterium betulae]|uniref:SDR family oxidoreductase n=1 Tax=Microbacterium betulae TaxID=2981139 RepID=A0AA97FKQ6_9MICO|nr:SDR family oxidoreductase [Microbacterium sp. AB]WOF24095.1 SDR family oxidoreductase [Microbacterium sp. AB]
MPIRPTIAVTGATGAVGGMVARAIAEHGVPQRLLARDPAKAPKLPGSEARGFDYTDPIATIEALEGIETVFMVSGNDHERLPKHVAFIDAAASAGVGHIVYTSFMSAAPDAVFTFARDHHATEEHIRASGLSWTFLRDNFYIDIMEDFVGEDGVIRGPAGEGRVSIVARADVARSAAGVLIAPEGHRSVTYDVTGPEALTMTEIASAIGEARGADVRFHDETIEEAYASRASFGAPDHVVAGWVGTYLAIARGDLAAVTDSVEWITGTKPMSLREFLG